MVIRRAVYYAQFALAVIAPGWLLVSQSLREGLGWDFLATLVVGGVLFGALIVIAALIVARKSARTAHAVSWPDAGLLLAVWFSVIVYGILALTPLVALVIALLVVLFWVAVWELATETRRRVRGFVDGLALTAERSRASTPGDAGPILVVPPPRDGSR